MAKKSTKKNGKKKDAGPQGVERMLLDPDFELEQKKFILHNLAMDGSEEANAVLSRILAGAAEAGGEDLWKAKIEEVNELLSELKNGPLRQAYFLSLAKSDQGRRAKIHFTDGSRAWTLVPDEDVAKSLERGDEVWVDAQGRALLYREGTGNGVGEEARLERSLDDGRVEVSLRDLDRAVLHAGKELLDQLERGEAGPGDTVLVASSAQFAFSALPHADGLAHFTFLARERVPDIRVDRDIASPARVIAEVEEHLRRELTQPEIGRRYGLRASLSVVLHGLSGTGKTLTLQAIWRRMYELMSEQTGVPVDDLPPRVLRLNASGVLSKWLGESDRLVARFFDEVEELAERPFETPDGREMKLPVLVLVEEMDSLLRARGSDHEAVYDRIQSTLLSRWDVTASSRLRENPIVFLSTTNLVEHCDVAALRRAGSIMERFRSLNRRSFSAVLETHLRNRPISPVEGKEPETARRKVVDDMLGFLYSPNGSDPGQLELACANQSSRLTKYRRDFLTGGLVDRAVQQAAARACAEERRGETEPGIRSPDLATALAEQVESVVEQITPRTVRNFLALPDGLHVTEVRRIPQARLLPHELEMAS